MTNQKPWEGLSAFVRTNLEDATRQMHDWMDKCVTSGNTQGIADVASDFEMLANIKAAVSLVLEPSIPVSRKPSASAGVRNRARRVHAKTAKSTVKPGHAAPGTYTTSSEYRPYVLASIYALGGSARFISVMERMRDMMERDGVLKPNDLAKSGSKARPRYKAIPASMRRHLLASGILVVTPDEAGGHVDELTQAGLEELKKTSLWAGVKNTKSVREAATVH